MGELLSHNIFAYCQNNPIVYSDPSGYRHVREIEGPTDVLQDEIEEAGNPFPLGKGWWYRSDNTSGPKGKHMHIYNERESEGQWAQNEDGSPHDEGANSPGDPPTTVQKKLKEKTGWDWGKKKKDYESTSKDVSKAVMTGALVTGGVYATYRVVRFLPSLAPPFWWTIPSNLAIP